MKIEGKKGIKDDNPDHMTHANDTYSSTLQPLSSIAKKLI